MAGCLLARFLGDFPCASGGELVGAAVMASDGNSVEASTSLCAGSIFTAAATAAAAAVAAVAACA